MARRFITVLTDDLDGGVADRTIEFGLDGVTYSIELSDTNIGALRRALDPYLAVASRLGRSRREPGGKSQRLGRVTQGPRRPSLQTEHTAPLSAVAERTAPTASVRTRKRGSRTSPTMPQKQVNHAIRQWATHHNIELAARGRIPRAIAERYHASMSNAAKTTS